MPDFFLIPQSEFARVREAVPNDLKLIADMHRANTLMTIKRAGSGHMGSSFSAMDIFTLLYYETMNTLKAGFRSPDRDVFFSSKGHDVPGQYAVLHSLGVLSTEKFIDLRRQGGSPGHPDVLIEGIEANTGSLGMGLSKGKGFAWSKRLRGNQGRVFILTGDGELQEGQNYEAFQTAVHQKLHNLTVIVDANTLQSDKRLVDISDLGDMPAKLRAFGWFVTECDGHDYDALRNALRETEAVQDRPKLIWAHTIKGKGISFMEHPVAMEKDGIYLWHSGAPHDEAYERAYTELTCRLNERLAQEGQPKLHLEPVPAPAPNPAPTPEFVLDAYGQALCRLMEERPEIVVLDGDLAADCRVRAVEERFPDRFIENGIAEQDMASFAGGLALAGHFPVVNSFGAFLAARANEQIYANNTEKTRILYAFTYAGLLPAGPGHSHQSVRDVSLMASLPDIRIFHPCNGRETEMGVEWLVRECPCSSALRLYIGPCPGKIDLPDSYTVTYGQGAVLREGKDLYLMAYGPVLVWEALQAAEELARHGFTAGVIAHPWLDHVHTDWLETVLGPVRHLVVMEDHHPAGALASSLLLEIHRSGRLLDLRVQQMAVSGVPECGTAREVLQFHGLDGLSVANQARALRDSLLREKVRTGV